MSRFLRAPTYRQTPEAAYNASGLWPVGGDLVLDTRHTAPAPTDQAIFLQRENAPMVFIVGSWPAPGATNVPSTEEIRAHAISNYATLSSLKVFVNGVEIAGERTEVAHDGYTVILDPGLAVYRADVDGLVHVRVEGTEDLAGAVLGEWTFTPAAVPKRVTLVTGQVPILRGIAQLAAAMVPIGQRLEGLATGQIPLRAAGGVFGEAAGRIVVGEFRVFPHARGTLNVAEIFRGAGGRGSLEILGYALRTQHRGSLEVSGPVLVTGGRGSLNVQELVLSTGGRGSLNVATLRVDTSGRGSLELWGEQSGHPYGRLLIRIQPLPADMITELEKLGIVFG